MTDYAMHRARRCGAHARTTGKPCCAPAMPNGRCRMHGGKIIGAPKGNAHAFKHGRRSAAMVEARREANDILRLSRLLLREMV